MLVIDDVHLADTATTRWLGQAVRRLADSRVAVVAARRAEESVPLPRVTTFTWVRRFLVEEGPRFTFAHSLVREALASAVGASRAAYIHRGAARALGSRSGADPLAVARRARLGGELAAASAMLVTAARMAVARFDQEEALRLLDEAVALDDTVAARLERARLCSMLARYEQSAEDIEVAQSRGAGPEALEVAAWSAHLQRGFDQALILADRGARRAIDADLRTSCLALGGGVSLVRLDGLAGLESWWITAEVARAFGVGEWEDLARRRVGELRTRAGGYASALEREAGRLLG